MSSQVLIEVTELADLDLDKTPPCECVLIQGLGMMHYLCGKPSVVRVRTECTHCNMVGVAFYCQPHYDGIKDGTVVCIRCDSKLSKVHKC